MILLGFKSWDITMFVGQIRKYWDFCLVFYPYFGQIKNPNNKTMQKHLLKAEMEHREPEREGTFDLEQDTEQVLASKFMGYRWLCGKSIRVQQNILFTSVFSVHEKSRWNVFQHRFSERSSVGGSGPIIKLLGIFFTPIINQQGMMEFHGRIPSAKSTPKVVHSHVIPPKTWRSNLDQPDVPARIRTEGRNS